MKLAAKWTDDCQGKKDFDGSIVRISTRYWPRGGGFAILANGEWLDNETRPQVRPSAHATIVLCHGEPREGSPDGDYADLIEREFEGETEQEVTAQVEAWAQEQFERIVTVMQREFAPSSPDAQKEGE